MMSAAHTVFMVGDRRPAKLDRIQPTWYGVGQGHGHDVNVMGEILIRVERQTKQEGRLYLGVPEGVGGGRITGGPGKAERLTNG